MLRRRDQIAADRARPAEINAAPFSPDVLRALIETVGCLALPQAVFA